MKVLFIGGTGNISSDCAELLHRRGHDIGVISRGRTPVPSDYQAFQADRNDQAALQTVRKDFAPDVVINFIGYDPPDIETDCAVFEGSVAQYIFISTAMVYAKPHRTLPITEEHPLGNPYSEYAQKKLVMEEWLLARRAETGFPVTIVRPSHTYSHRWFPNVVSSAGYTFAARLVQGRPVFVPNQGTNPWTLTHTTDFAVGLAGLVGQEHAIGEAFHITSQEALPWTEIYAETAAALNAPPPNLLKIPVDFLCEQSVKLTGSIRGDKAEPARFDNTKLKRFVPDFTCRVPFAEGIRKSVAWFQAHPDQRTINPEMDALFDRVIAAWQAAPTG